jgi:ribosomal protein S1
VVLDVDNDKKIIDLSEKLVDAKSNNKTICELTKDAFMVVSSKGSYGVCILQNTCNDIKIESQYSKYRIGDEVDCRLVPNINDVKSDLLLMALKQAPRPAQEVKEGASVNGVVKSIRGHSMFIQVGHSGKQP